MNIGYIDPVGGVSGDMLVAALLDAGGDEKQLLADLAKLPLEGWEWQCRAEKRRGFGGLKIDFLAETEGEERHFDEIQRIISQASFPKPVENTVLTAFSLLADAEAQAHQQPREAVHFHEVGAVDTILDICAAALLVHRMAIEEIHCGPLPMGIGSVDCAHGKIPVPAPALNQLLCGVPIYGNGAEAETVTPTGIALLKALHVKFGTFPPMTVLKTGVGLGGRDGDIPNLLRVFIGENNEKMERLYRLETTVDDMTGEDLGYLWEQIYAAGVNDLYYTPIYMKKGRPGLKITALVLEKNLEKVRNALFAHTSTLGIIMTQVERCFLKRHFEEIPTPYGEITFKCAGGYGAKKAKPEFEDLKAAAEATGKPIQVIRKAAETSFLREHSKK